MPEALPIELRTARLTLRPMVLADAEGLHPVFTDARVMQYFADPHQTIAETEAWVRGSVGALPEETREFTLWRSDQIIGKAGIWKSPEIGFLLHRDHWRHGLMREALTVLIPHLFATMDLPAITADVDPRNTASLALLAGLGFAETHRAAETIEIAGKWCDSVYLRLECEQVELVGAG